MTHPNKSEFGCVRFHNSPFSRLAREVGNTGCMSTDGKISPAALSAAEKTAEVYMYSVMDNTNGQVPPEYVILSRLLMEQVLLHALHVSAGRQVFQFTPALIAEFQRTDLSETPIGRMLLPYPAGFLHFGRQNDLELDDWWRTTAEYVDGAYFHCGPEGALTIQLTLSRPDDEASGMPGPRFSIAPTDLFLPAHQAIDKALDIDYADTEEEEVNHALQAWDLASRSIIHAALSLVLNALFYLDAYGADTDQVLPEATPKNLRDAFEQAAKTGKPKLLRNARNALVADGFTEVRLCGTSFSAPPPSDIHDTSGSSVRPHWRRGHWRMQPCGPKLSLIKRVWVRPALVGKDSNGVVTGHVYSIEAGH